LADGLDAKDDGDNDDDEKESSSRHCDRYDRRLIESTSKKDG